MRITFEAPIAGGVKVIHIVEPMAVVDGSLVAIHQGEEKRFPLDRISDIYCTETANIISVKQRRLACAGCDLYCNGLGRFS